MKLGYSSPTISVLHKRSTKEMENCSKKVSHLRDFLFSAFVVAFNTPNSYNTENLLTKAESSFKSLRIIALMLFGITLIKLFAFDIEILLLPVKSLCLFCLMFIADSFVYASKVKEADY